VAEVADLREVVARSLRLAFAVILEAEVVDEEEVVVVVTLRQSQPRAIAATAVEVRK
jgi:predicted lysophospholipase L1 biosynthesis ABC-type transport system permease subunit